MTTLGWIVVGAEAVAPHDDWLAPAERATVAELALPKRRAEWRLGRWAGKSAAHAWLSQCAFEHAWRSPNGALLGAVGGPPLGLDAAATISIVRAADGAPEVFVGEAPAPIGLSLSHAGGRGAAVVGPREAAFGVDLETVEPRSAGFVEDFFTPREAAWVASAPFGCDLAATFVWAAKEATLKALRLGLREDTRAVEVAPCDLGAGWRAARTTVAETGRRFAGGARVQGGQVLVVLVAERPDASRAALDPP